MDTIATGLSIGTAREAADKELLTGNSIEVIVSLARKAPEHDDIEIRHIPLSNGSGTSQQDFDAAVDALRDAIQQDRSVLVHCRQGVSRSVAVAATSLAMEEDTTLREAIATIERERPQADPDRALIDLAEAYLTARR